jgi:hypothetical protein
MRDNSPEEVDSIPSDGTTMSEVLAQYASAGFAGSFDIEPARGRVRCAQCGIEGRAAQFEMFSLRRLEGASDPDDEAAVVAMVCFNCAAKGTIVVMYGPQASVTEAEILAAVRNESRAGVLPPNSAPGETVGDTTSAAG